MEHHHRLGSYDDSLRSQDSEGGGGCSSFRRAPTSSNGSIEPQDDRGGGGGVGDEGGNSANGKGARRAYRACANCRSRKAKCDLGDIANPREPPCARCKRESRECTFLPSRRGGNLTARSKERAAEAAGNGNGGHDSDLYEPSKRKRSSSPINSLQAIHPGWADEELRRGDPAASASQHQHRQQHSPPLVASTSLASSSQAHHHALPTSSEGSFPPILSPYPEPLNIYALAAPASASVSESDLFVPQQQQPLTDGIQASVPNVPGISSSSPSFPTSFSPFADQLSPPSNLAGQPVFRSPGPRRPPPPHIDSAAGVRDRDLAAVHLEPPPSHSQLSHSHHRGSLARHGSGVSHRPESFVFASMSNEADALSLLALTASGEKVEPPRLARSAGGGSEKAETPDGRNSERSWRSERQPTDEGRTPLESEVVKEEPEPGDDSISIEGEAAIPPLVQFDLVKKGVLQIPDLVTYVTQFFTRHHQIFPMVPHARIPKSLPELERFAYEDKQLLTAFVVIASRYDQDRPTIHEKAWEVMSEYITDTVVRGKEPCVGFVESMLLLSENVPRPSQDGAAANPSAPWDESTQSWYLVGHAVRTGYLLGLDQQTLFVDPQAPTTPQLDRERLAWTYCYLFDRHISIRLGKAFWSRGPGLCFSPSADALTNFPSLRDKNFSYSTQAAADLCQVMTNAHDLLFPSADRTISLVRAGEYYKFLDEFTRSINGFEAVWKSVKFPIFPCEEIVWCTFHYLRLYIYAFAFQAHVQRAAESGADSHARGGGMFPRGTTQSPDAKFIFESIDAARQILQLCTERLHPGGALPFLPGRFFLWFTYAAVFLLKALYSGAVFHGDTKPIIELIQKVIFCLANASPDRQHLGIRHALLLRTVAKKLRQSFSSDEWISTTGNASPILPARYAYNTDSPSQDSQALPNRPYTPGVGQSASTLNVPLSSTTPSHLSAGDAQRNGEANGGGGGAFLWPGDFGDIPFVDGADLLSDGAVGGLGELAFLDMELGDDFWHSVLPGPGPAGPSFPR